MSGHPGPNQKHHVPGAEDVGVTQIFAVICHMCSTLNAGTCSHMTEGPKFLVSLIFSLNFSLHFIPIVCNSNIT